MKTARLVQRGFPFSRFVNFEKATGLSREKLARLLRIPVRTLSRRQAQGKLTSAESDRLHRATRLLDAAVELFEGNAASALQWLLEPQRGLGGEVPFEFAATEVGAREVENLIGRLEHGVFS